MDKFKQEIQAELNGALSKSGKDWFWSTGNGPASAAQRNRLELRDLVFRK